MCPLKVLHCVKVEDLFLYNVSLGSRHHRINCYCACTKGGCLSHGGSSSPRAAPEGSPRAQPWPLPLCAPQGQGRPRAGWTPPWLRCWETEVPQWPGEMSFQHRGGSMARSESQLVLAHWGLRSTKGRDQATGCYCCRQTEWGEVLLLRYILQRNQHTKGCWKPTWDQKGSVCSWGTHTRAGIPGGAAGRICWSRDTPEERAAGRPAT